MKLKENTLTCARFGEPETVAAKFLDALSEDVRLQIQADILAGQDLLAIFHGYKRAGLTGDLKGASQMIEAMERVFSIYEARLQEIGKKP